MIWANFTNQFGKPHFCLQIITLPALQIQQFLSSSPEQSFPFSLGFSACSGSDQLSPISYKAAFSLFLIFLPKKTTLKTPKSQ